MDVSSASKRKFEEFARIVYGQEKGTIPRVTFSIADFSIVTSICTERSFNVIPVRYANPPETIEKYEEHLKNLAANKVPNPLYSNAPSIFIRTVSGLSVPGRPYSI